MEGQLNIVQRVVKHPKYDMMIPENNIISAVRSNYLVGTFMMINGQQLDSVFGGRLLRRYVLLREVVLGFVVSHWTPMRGVYLK